MGIVSAAPSIVAWSSSGGNPANKDNPQDLMYLIQPGDEITFSVTANESCNFTWEVNKVEEKNTISPSTTDSFTFTVPSLNCSQDPSECIWEIHVKAFNENGEAHQEWVISTLNESEAPDFFEYFTDKKYQNRAETDPWGRALPVWEYNPEYDGPDVSNCDYRISAGQEAMLAILNGHDVAFGTWKFRFYVPPNEPHDPQGISYIDYRFLTLKSGDAFKFRASSESHWFFYHYNVNGTAATIMIEQNSGLMRPLDKFYDGKIIRMPDGTIYVYLNDILLWYWQEAAGGNETSREEDWDTFSIYLDQSKQDMPDKLPIIDCIEIYKNKYLLPSKNVTYGKYASNWLYANGTYPQYYEPIERQGIIVRGKGVRLIDIYNMIDNESLFTYDPITKTATCYTDLVLDYGAELIIENETLKFHCNSPGEHWLSMLWASRIKIINSTITSDNNNYWIWRSDSTTHLGFPGGFLLTPYTYGPMFLAYTSLQSIIIENSTIDNTAYMFLDSFFELKIKNSKIINLNEVDIGNYSKYGTTRERQHKEFVKGDKSFWILLKEFPAVRFEIDNVTFSGKSSPVNITFIINADRKTEERDWGLFRLNIYNSDFGNENIVVRKSAKFHPVANPDWPRWFENILGLVNCKFKNLIVPTDMSYVIPKYYLDVKVVDGNGNPVKNATVRVVNEVDNSNYPAENIIFKRILHHNYPAWPENEEWAYEIILYEPLNYTLTSSNGHTPLPSEDPAHTIVIGDYVKDINGATQFTYTITASYNGKTASLSGLDIDESWYREDPNVPTKTVVCNIDTGNCWIEGVATGTLKGKVTDKDTGLPIVGATVTANSHQTTTNSTGDYIITNLLPGNYTVTASKDGYFPNTATAEILANQTTTLNFQLTKDTKPPVISNITISSVTSHSALISWDTNEPSTSLVKYGTSSGNYPYSKENTSYTTSHSITLTNLQPNTTYYFVVNSTDKAGNSAQSTEHSFKIKELSNIVYVARDGTGDYNCDGEDDQIEINQAISYINSIGGGTVHLKEGTYIISDSINLSSNLIFEGEGTEKTTIKIEDGSTKENWATIAGDGISSTTIKNLTINGNKDNCPVPKRIDSNVDAFHLYKLQQYYSSRCKDS